MSLRLATYILAIVSGFASYYGQDSLRLGQLIERGNNLELVAQYKHDGNMLVSRVQPDQRTEAWHISIPRRAATPPNNPNQIGQRLFSRKGNSRESSEPFI